MEVLRIAAGWRHVLLLTKAVSWTLWWRSADSARSCRQARCSPSARTTTASVPAVEPARPAKQHLRVFFYAATAAGIIFDARLPSQKPAEVPRSSQMLVLDDRLRVAEVAL